MRQSVDIDLAFIRLGLTERATEADVRARADQLRRSAARQQADRFLFDAIDEVERAGLGRLEPSRGPARLVGPGGLPRLLGVMGACFGLFLMAALVVGAAAGAVGAPDAITRWLVGLVPLLAVPVAVAIVVAIRPGSSVPSGSMEA